MEGVSPPSEQGAGDYIVPEAWPRRQEPQSPGYTQYTTSPRFLLFAGKGLYERTF